jgi:hypothetical protein
MEPIVIESRKLRPDRLTAVRRLVTPLLPIPPGIIVTRVGIDRDTYTLSVLPHGRDASSYLNPESVLVRTSLPRILMNYYETWRPTDQEEFYCLDRIYMHFHLADEMKPQQLFSLHCDPCLKDSDVHFRYKRGPHVHIEGARPDLGRAHISLCLTDPSGGGADMQTLTASFTEAVRMVTQEIFPCWERRSS